ncbi:MAG: IS200/IS605 family accessory protein TnpB-related protein [Caldisphaeraceae archaeon]|nr:IS200/IS605 family accessory protein TnpB-related protein [Caldisphaeraceae archaeon]
MIITFRKAIEKGEVVDCIGWDSNLLSLDGFSPKHGWIKVGLSKLYHIHRIYEVKRKNVQNLSTRKKSVEGRVKRYGERERNRSNDFLHKLTTELAKAFPNAIQGFEDLDKAGMYSKSKKHNRGISKQNWKGIINLMNYKSRIRLVDPRYISSTCPLCGGKLIKLRGEKSLNAKGAD